MKKRIILKNPFRAIKTLPRITHAEAVPPDNKDNFQINPAVLIRLLSLNARPLVIFVGAVILLAALIIILMPNRYRSTASIMPTGENSELNSLKEIAGLEGIGYRNHENSSLLYPAILRSNQVKDAVLDKSFMIHDGDKTLKMKLNDYLGSENPEMLRAGLDDLISIKTDRKTGLITIAAETRYPELSRAVLNQFLAELEIFNTQKRRSSAGDHVRYLDRELREKEQKLREVEDSLEAYQMANRNWDGTTDPEILKTLLRLRRDIEIKTKTYILLQEQYEMARLDQQKDVPIVRVLDYPSLPTLKSGPHRLGIVLLSGMTAFWIGLLFLILINAQRQNTLFKEASQDFDRMRYSDARQYVSVKE
jgi:tyrosine-protein kinase Etk/Wzc